jgi:acetyl-CoA synthetase
MGEPPDVLARWEDEAASLTWEAPWDKVHIPETPWGRWFPGASLNVATNCLDRHLRMRRNQVAIHWEGEPGDRRTMTYGELHDEVAAFAGALHQLGVGVGDRVALYMGLLPETIVAMLACARIGAIHAVLAAALPADALADRLADLQPRLLVTQDGAWRHGTVLPLKARADEALAAVASVEQTVAVRRTGIDVAWYQGDLWYHDLIAPAGRSREPDPPVPVGADHPLLVVYIANRRGRPTGIVHGSGRLLTYSATMHRHGLSAAADEVLWCAVEVGWVAGQTHGTYGPLACGATSVLYEGMLDTPTHARLWEIIQRYGVNTLVTTPSVVRRIRQRTDGPPEPDAVASLRRVVTAGEPIEDETREWLLGQVGGDPAAIVDAWGQTELGGIVTISGSEGLPDAGLDVVLGEGRPAQASEAGELVVRNPWPGMFIGIEGDQGEAAARYWERYGVYTTGDSAMKQPDGSVTFLGRIDPVINVSGQLVSLTEVREVLLEHPFVKDAEVVERSDPLSGQAVAACIVPAAEGISKGDLAQSLRAHVREILGGLAQPSTLLFIDGFPKDVSVADRRRSLKALSAPATSQTSEITEAELRAAAPPPGMAGPAVTG